MASTTEDSLTLTLPRKQESTLFRTQNSQTTEGNTVVTDAPRTDFANLLASAYLRYTEQGSQLNEQESVQSFVTLHQLHHDLAEEAERYLNAEIPFVFEGQPIQPLLLNFAAYRITQASRQYLAETLQDKSSEEIAALKNKIQRHQAEYDAILHHV